MRDLGVVFCRLESEDEWRTSGYLSSQTEKIPVSESRRGGLRSFLQQTLPDAIIHLHVISSTTQTRAFHKSLPLKLPVVYDQFHYSLYTVGRLIRSTPLSPEAPSLDQERE